MSKMLKGFFELITLFCEKILIFNIPIIKATIQNCFIFFIRLMYIFLYIIIHIPGISMLNVRISPFSKGGFNRTSEGIFKITFGKTDCFFWGFFYSLICFADSIDFYMVRVTLFTVFI